VDLINNCDARAQAGFFERVDRIKKTYAEMSDIYQAKKGAAKNIPLK
jgi:hypothetical protein